MIFFNLLQRKPTFSIFNLHGNPVTRKIFTFVLVWYIFYRISFPEGINGIIYGTSITPWSSPNQIKNAYEGSDISFYFEAALTWANLQGLNENQIWITHLWPPGLPLVLVPLIWLSKVGIPIYLSIFLLSSIIWSICMTKILFLKSKVSYFLISTFLLTLFFFSWDVQFLFRERMLNAENLSIGFAVLSLVLIFEMLINSQKEHPLNHSKILLTGSLLGYSNLIRASIDFQLILLALVFLGFLFVVKFFNVRTSINIIGTKIVGFTTITAIAISFPWRLIINPMFHNGARGVLSDAGNLMIQSAWLNNSPDWSWSGPSWACYSDPPKCLEIKQSFEAGLISNKDLYKSAAISVISNPGRFLRYKIHYAVQNWIPGGLEKPIGIKEAVSIVFILLIIYCLSYLIISFESRKNLAFVFSTILLLFSISSLAVTHFESRYFIPTRIYSLVTFVLLIAYPKAKSSSCLSSKFQNFSLLAKKTNYFEHGYQKGD